MTPYVWTSQPHFLPIRLFTEEEDMEMWVRTPWFGRRHENIFDLNIWWVNSSTEIEGEEEEELGQN